MNRAISLDLWPADEKRYADVRRQHKLDLRTSCKDHEMSRVVFRCPICRHLATLTPCLACRLRNDIPLPEELLEGGAR